MEREQVCFAGSGCLPLSPWPPGPFRGLAGRVEKGGCLAVNWIHWQQQQPPAQPEPRQFTDTAVAARAARLHPADVSRRLTTSSVLDLQTNLLPIAMAAWTTIMENTGPVCACVCYKQMPNLC